MKLKFIAPLLLVLYLVSCKKGDEAPVDNNPPTNPPTNPPANPPVTAPLNITSITPTHAAGGTNITIIGTGFSTTPANSTVKINGKTATVVTAKSDSLVVTIPIKAGTGDVILTSGDKTVTGPVFKYDTVWMVSSYAGSTTAGFANGTALNAQFNGPHGLCVDADGNLYIADRSNFKIRKISATGEVSTIVGTTNGFTDGPASTAQMKGPFGICRDAQGAIYFSDYMAHAIRKYTAADGLVTLAGNGTQGYQPGGTSVALFAYPAGVCVNNAGILHIMDASNVILRYIQYNTVNNLAGYPCQSGSTDGWAMGARFDNPFGLCTDGTNFYVADTYGQRIRKVNNIGDVTTIAGNGMQGKADGTSTAATFFQPSAICIDANKNLYVADTQNHLIRKISPEGVVTTIAGSGSQGSADGIGTAASFNKPFGICVDAQGALYVSDTYNNKIRKIVLQ